jgi:heme exporter protein C
VREKVIYGLGILASVLLIRNLHEMFIGLPDEASQGAIYRILYFHVPGFFVFATSALAAVVSSVLFLARKKFVYDEFAAAVIEVGLTFGAINLVTGMIWGRIIWGVWWAWDARLTFMLVSWLMYGGYLMLRQAIEEPSQRAKIASTVAILTFPAVVITYKAIDWWVTQHPGAVLSFRTGGGKIDPAMESLLYMNFLALLLFAIALVMIRMRQEQLKREIDGLRREAHAIQ